MKLTAVLLLAGTMVLSACGSRSEGDSATATAGTDGTATVDPDCQPKYDAEGKLLNCPGLGAAVPTSYNITLQTDANIIETGGTDGAKLTATILDEARNAVVDQQVSFSATGGALQETSSVTDENGEARAILRLPNDYRNQDIEVTVTSGGYTEKVKVRAQGSVMKVVGEPSLIPGAKAEVKLTLTAGNGDAIANQSISVASRAGNVITPAQVVTDASGQAELLVDSVNGSDTITVSALDGTLVDTYSFTVTEDQLIFTKTGDAATYEVNKFHDATVTWTRQGQPVAGQALRFGINAGQIVSGTTVTTNSAGSAAITFLSSSAGDARITVAEANSGEPQTFNDIRFVATVPASVRIDASSSYVAANGTSALSATVYDINGNPVSNTPVVFSSADLKGGQLNPATGTTDAAGEATVSFRAGSFPTSVNEIELVVALEGNSAINDRMNLTVVKRQLNVTLGTSNEIGIKPLGTQYFMPFIVQVADGAGKALPDATVELSIRPIRYGKGYMVQVNDKGAKYDGSDNWSPDHWVVDWDRSIECPTEDQNGNRFLDVGEDRNNNGSLDPQDPALLAAVEGDNYATIENGSVTTDKNGSGFFDMLYPASNSNWAFVEITARARNFGVEAVDTFVTYLHLPAKEAEDDGAPANIHSPYGVTFANVVMKNADGNDVTVEPCANTN